MERWTGRVALVTGASAGIGAELTRRLTREGMTVVAAARSLDRLEKLKDDLKNEKGSVLPVNCDLREESQILAMFETIGKEVGGVDVLINNAGLNFNAPLLSGETEQWKNILDVNVLALCICTREAVKSMKERGIEDGHIINISSVCGRKVENSPPFHFLMGSKFNVTALTEGLRYELRALKKHFRATTISPGVVVTEALAKTFPENPEIVNHVYTNTKRIVPADVADAVVYALQAPKHVQVHEVCVAGTEDQDL